MGLSDNIRTTYSQASKEVQKKLDAFFARHKKLAEQKLKAVEEGKISESDYQQWLLRQMFTGQRWREKLDDITRTYVDADETARQLVGDRAKNVFATFANSTARDIQSKVGGGVSFDMYDRHTVERLLRENPQMLPEWKINEKKDYRWNAQRVQNAITQGIIQGESIPQLAKRLTSELSAGNEKHMTLFARTAMTGAQNAGRMERLHEAQDMGIVVKKKWLAAHDDRVRDAHAELDGQEVGIDEPFHSSLGDIMYPGDPTADPANVYNCRCTLTYVYDVQASRENLREQEENTQQVSAQHSTETTYKAQTPAEYTEWQRNHSTRSIIYDQFEQKYGVKLEREVLSDGTIVAQLPYSEDRFIKAEGEWLSDIFQAATSDIDQVSSGYGHCGYIQSSDGSKAINAYLRRGEVGLYPKGEMQQTIDAMNRLIEHTTITEDISVDRCAGIDALERMGIDVGQHGRSFRIGHAFCTDGLDIDAIVDTINNDYIGAELVDRGFMSASVVRDKNIFGGSDVTFTLRVPQGTHAYISDNLTESEIVLSPDTKQRIVGAKVSERTAYEYDGTEVKRKVVEIILEVVAE